MYKETSQGETLAAALCLQEREAAETRTTGDTLLYATNRALAEIGSGLKISFTHVA